MHPGFMSWWARHHGASRHAYAYAGCGPVSYAAHRRHGDGEGLPDDAGFSGGAFGVRRPLRFLAYKLDLDERQTEQLAAILDDLKTERAQAAVDHRRMTSAMADLFGAGAFDAAKAAETAKARVAAAERLAGVQAKALERVHALLDEEQRKTFAYLLRTGVLAI
jgi:Spy/CpxP family protein refolding chaperone